MFLILDDMGLKLGNASVTEYINETLLPDRPLNYYVSVSAGDDRAFDMLIGATLARAMRLRRRHPQLAARIYTSCHPGDGGMVRALGPLGFDAADAEIRMRHILSASDRIPLPPVGCNIAPVLLEDSADIDALLARVNEHSVVGKTVDWLSRLQREAMFCVLGCWQENRLLGELILTTYGSEGRIEFFYTREEYRGRGIATALIAHAGDMLVQSGIRSINAEVWKRNTAAMGLLQGLHFDSVAPLLIYPGMDI